MRNAAQKSHPIEIIDSLNYSLGLGGSHHFVFCDLTTLWSALGKEVLITLACNSIWLTEDIIGEKTRAQKV